MPILSRSSPDQHENQRARQRLREMDEFNSSHQLGDAVTLARNARATGRIGFVTGPAREITTTRVYVPVAGVGLVPLDQIRAASSESGDTDAASDHADAQAQLNQMQGRLSEALQNNQDLLAQLQARDGLQQLATVQPHVADAAGDFQHDPNRPGHGAY